MDDLKPCPFCSGFAVLERDLFDVRVKCVDCFARGGSVTKNPSNQKNSDQLAIDKWNQRNA